MKIGYCVEGRNDKALIEGLQRRWCPNAELVEGSYRGSEDRNIRREIPKICLELNRKGADVFVFLTDEHKSRWRKTLKQNIDRIPQEHKHRTIFAIAHKEIEYWFCLDAAYCAQQICGTTEEWHAAEDPKGMFNSRAKQKWGDESCDIREGVAMFVSTAPLKKWIQQSPSFRKFYEDCKDMGALMNCSVTNELE